MKTPLSSGIGSMNLQLRVRTTVLVGILALQFVPVTFVARSAPANDKFINAEIISGTTGTASGSNTAGTKDSNEPDHAENPGGSSIWYRWTAPTNGPFSFNTFGSSFDTLLAVYTGNSLASLALITANDDFGTGLTSEVGFVATAGTTYSVAVDGYNDETGAETGTVTLNWLLETPPANDLFANATVITGLSGSVASSNVGASKEAGEPIHGGDPGGRSVWFRWTAPVTGEFTFNTSGSAIETLLGVYTGASVNALSFIATNDSIFGGAGAPVTFSAIAGTTYSIAIDGFAREAGSLALNWLLAVDTSVTGTLQSLHSFTNSNDGASPHAAVILSGNTLYGTSVEGGGYGVVFKVNTDGTGYSILHRFLNYSGGANSYSPLLLLGDKLYGTTRFGGIQFSGTVFAIGTNGTGFTNLYRFAAGTGNPLTNSDGAGSVAGLIAFNNRLYGTTAVGGPTGHGTLFAVNTNGTGFTNLHYFAAMSGSPGTNSGGANPSAALVLSGNTLYGTALKGGNLGFGTIFSVKTNGADFTTLHHFPWSFDGAYPRGLSLAGNRLYGAGNGGGLTGNGSVFAINTDGSGFTNLYSFSDVLGATFTNKYGANPFGGVQFYNDRLYGTALGGGSGGSGTIFSMNTNGADLWLLHTFTTGTGASRTNYDGRSPRCGLLVSGNTLYGTSERGGTDAWGTVYRVSWGAQLPQLAIGSSAGNVILRWPHAETFGLEATTNLSLLNSWSPVTDPAVTNSGEVSVTTPASGGAKFFRLKSP